jgi:predicted amidophosphoribosyltransferase
MKRSKNLVATSTIRAGSTQVQVRETQRLTMSKLTQAGFSPYTAFGWCTSCRKWIPKSEIICEQHEKKLVTICPHCGNYGIRLRPHQKIAKHRGWDSKTKLSVGNHA